MDHQEISRIILDWYAINKRPLPWRDTTDPYKILVSEIMLQQTQVDRVLPKYRLFLARFPTAKDLAHASKIELLSQWSGLGYNRRALLLQKATRACINGFPKTPAELVLIKGIGPYTSAAVASFAYNYDIAVLDTNVIRILIRVFYGSKVTKNPPTKKELDTLAQSLLPHGMSRLYNNAIMDFGANVCTAVPKCTICPLQSRCTIFQEVRARTIDQSILNTIGTPKGGFGTIQPKFHGSRRFYRGKILKFLKSGAVKKKDLVRQIDDKKKSREELISILADLEKEGFIRQKNGSYSIAD